MTRMTAFSPTNPTGTAAGMEPVRHDIIKAAVNNTPAPTPAAVPPVQPATAASPLVAKSLRLPADLVEFIDFTYTKDKRLKKQDAYTQALEAYFRPLMDKPLV